MSMMESQFWIADRPLGQAYFRLRRTATPVDTLENFARQLESMATFITKVDTSRLGLLFDVRDGPMRNDPEFEAIIAPYRDKMFHRFRRVAMLLKTPAGKLQAMRLNEVRTGKVTIFTDEAEAIAFLKARD